MPPLPAPPDISAENTLQTAVPLDESAPHPAPEAAKGKIGSPEPIAALNRVKIQELMLPWSAREPLADVRTACPSVVLSEKLCPYLRARVAEMLNRAQSALPSGYRLKVGTCLRTRRMQAHGWDSYFARMKEEHPNWPLSALRRATNKYYAPYDQPAPPGHTTGGAVDVGLLDPDGNSLDMIAPTQGWEAAYTWSEKIGSEAKRHRMMMVNAMLSAGFSNCRDEYWHYSWGDSAWAVRVGKSECPYGWAHPPVALETDFAGAAAGELQIETQRDLQGRALSARGSLSAATVLTAIPQSETQPLFAVGLYWGYGVPVTLDVRLPAGFPPDVTLYSGEVGDEWRPIQTIGRYGDTLTLQITPDRDRLILTTAPLPSPSELQA